MTLPHTWNAADGTDGGNDYFRGTCTYTKEFAAPAHADDEKKTYYYEMDEFFFSDEKYAKVNDYLQQMYENYRTQYEEEG